MGFTVQMERSDTGTSREGGRSSCTLLVPVLATHATTGFVVTLLQALL